MPAESFSRDLDRGEDRERVDSKRTRSIKEEAKAEPHFSPVSLAAAKKEAEEPVVLSSSTPPSRPTRLGAKGIARKGSRRETRLGSFLKLPSGESARDSSRRIRSNQREIDETCIALRSNS